MRQLASKLNAATCIRKSKAAADVSTFISEISALLPSILPPSVTLSFFLSLSESDSQSQSLTRSFHTLLFVFPFSFTSQSKSPNNVVAYS
ncbi:hypothetical protein RIF29_27592 [Crotalaria pallida]|uniref:Uncharacterized protein n=1 Tax=Crotalaria pallida TaxID=3830 RepID=A0AAN9EQA1_CROPI